MAENERLKQLKESILDTLSQLKAVRGKSEGIRWDACGYVRHRHNSFQIGDSKIPEIRLFDTAGVAAYRTLCDGLAGHLISPSIPKWFAFTVRGNDNQPADEIHGANKWLEDAEQIIRQIFSQSDFYPSTKLAIEDCVSQGTSAEMIIDDMDGDQIAFDCIDPQEFYIAEDEHRKVNVFYREYEMTAQQAQRKWDDQIPAEVQQLINKGSGHQMCKFVHAIYPQTEAISKHGVSIISTSKRYASVHYSYTGDEIFRESGFDEFPVAVHRWQVKGTSPYGTSPVIDILPELKKLNELEKQYSIAVQKLVNPPMFAPDTLKGKLNMNPGGQNFVAIQHTGKPEAVHTSLDLSHLQEEIAELKRSIKEDLHTDLFNILMRQEQQRTATEVREIKAEGLVLLSAIIGNFQEEKIVPMVMRTFAILARKGVIPEPPPELKKVSSQRRGGGIKVELSGILAQSLKAHHQTTGITQGMQFVAAVMQLSPEAAINVDFDKMVRLGMIANNMPQEIIREWTEVKKIKKRMAEEQQAQAEMERAQAQAEVASKMDQGGAEGGPPMPGILGGHR